MKLMGSYVNYKHTSLDIKMEQFAFWDEEEPEEKIDKDPEIERIAELTLQNQNLRLLMPIYRIEQSKGKIGDRNGFSQVDESQSKNIDTIYLSILTLEYYASYALNRESIPISDVIEYLQDKIKVMNPVLTANESHRLAEWIHNSLRNQNNDYKAFDFSYFNAFKQKMQRYEFRLIVTESSSHGNKCKITEEGIIALLTYINANPKLQDEVTALLTQRLIKAGRYEEALQMAERSRKKVIQYQEQISNLVGKLNYNPEAGKISKTILPVIQASSQHVSDRIKEEAETLQNITELSQDKLDNKNKILLIRLKEAIKENLTAYQKLYEHIDYTYKNFESTFSRLLRPNASTLPNMITGLLEPICKSQIDKLSIHGDSIINQIIPAKIPRLFDVTTLLDKLDSAGIQEEIELFESNETDMKDITRIEPNFAEEMIEACKRYYQQKIEKRQTFTLQELLIEVDKVYFSDNFQRCLAYVVMMSFADNQSLQNQTLNIHLTKLEPFQHKFMTGDNLLIKNKG